MMIYSVNGKTPRVEKAAFIAESADLIGDIELADGVNIWFNAVIRADLSNVKIGKGSNLQDNATIHVDTGYPASVGEDVIIGHQALLHGCTIGNNCLIGMGAIILNGAVIKDNSVVGAGALVTAGKTFPERSLIVGSPARTIRVLSDENIADIKKNAGHYVENGELYRRDLKQTDRC